ncbi:MAG: cysteine desulfurase, partial [Parachlamydiaceae bacterium]|nr:cysteine desulfurase [Parachlamydiaceae bacterium]
SEGNPSSIHSFGQKARQKLIQARGDIASYLGVRPHEIIFTSGGTEGVNILLQGLFIPGSSGHIITSNIEHSCVFSSVKKLEKNGLHSTFLETGMLGAVTPEAVKQALRPDTRLITLMAVNNETGVKTDLEAIAVIAQEHKIPFFVDAVALMGKEEFKIPPGVTAMAFSGHKFHAPKGIGFLVARSSLKLAPLIIGGDQEFGRRAGTENLSGIVGMSTAIELLRTELPSASKRMEELRNIFEKELMRQIPGVSINGQGPRVVNTSNLAFQGVEGETLLTALDLAGIAVSHGSACSSGALEPSRILLNMGCSKEVAGSSMRFSLSRFTTLQEIEICIETIVKVVLKLRH